jgi:aromatic ring hydroxylase
MPLKKRNEYIALPKSLDLEANVMGKKTQDLPDHLLVIPSVRAVALTFDCAHSDETRNPSAFRAVVVHLSLVQRDAHLAIDLS